MRFCIPAGQRHGENQVVVITLAPCFVAVMPRREADLDAEVLHLANQNLGQGQALCNLEPIVLQKHLKHRDQVTLGYSVVFSVTCDRLTTGDRDGRQGLNFCIQARFRRASLRTQRGSLHEAERDLARAVALMDSSGLREYAAEVYELLGTVYELQAHRSAALASYERAVEAARHRQAVASIKAARRAESALIRVALRRAAVQDEAWLVFILFLVMIAGVTLGFNLHRFGNCLPGKTIHQGSTMLEPVPTGDPLWDKRMGDLFQILTDAAVALPYLDDPKLIDVIERRGRVYELAQLYGASVALEMHRDTVEFEDPVDAYRKYLSYQFRKRRLARPGSVLEWMDFFRPVE